MKGLRWTHHGMNGAYDTPADPTEPFLLTSTRAVTNLRCDAKAATETLVVMHA